MDCLLRRSNVPVERTIGTLTQHRRSRVDQSEGIEFLRRLVGRLEPGESRNDVGAAYVDTYTVDWFGVRHDSLYQSAFHSKPVPVVWTRHSVAWFSTLPSHGRIDGVGTAVMGQRGGEQPRGSMQLWMLRAMDTAFAGSARSRPAGFMRR